MKTCDVPLQSIKPGWETRKDLETYGTKKVDRMAKELGNEGQRDPIIVNPTLTQIRDGHTRYLAARQLGLKTIRVTMMTDEEWKEKLGIR